MNVFKTNTSFQEVLMQISQYTTAKKTFCNASCLLLYEMTFMIIAGVPGEKP